MQGIKAAQEVVFYEEQPVCVLIFSKSKRERLVMLFLSFPAFYKEHFPSDYFS